MYGLWEQRLPQTLPCSSRCCAICGRRPTNGISLHVDHSHKTGKIRGLLCFRCNNGIGDFRENPEIIGKAAAYIVRDWPPDPEDVTRIRERVAALRQI